jgi:hypothetical protein
MNGIIDLVGGPSSKSIGLVHGSKGPAIVAKKASGDCIDLVAMESTSSKKDLKKRKLEVDLGKPKKMKVEEQVATKRTAMLPYMFDCPFDATEFHQFTVHGNPRVMTDPSYHRGAGGAGSFKPYNKCTKVSCQLKY